MKMVQAGKLHLNSPITDYLSAASLEIITTPSTRKLVERITIKHLLSHTSGLSQSGFEGYPNSNPAVNLQSVLSGATGANSQHFHLSGLPGQRFSYSGRGTTVLHLIMESIPGNLLPELVHELVLEPLGMEKFFCNAPTKEDNHASAYFTGYTPCDVNYHIFPEKAAAGLWTTPTDLLKVVKALQHSLTAQDDSGFLPITLAPQMLTEVSAGIALSWNAPKDPSTTFSHPGGNSPGWRCYLLGYADLKNNGALDPKSEGLGFCIMTTSAEGVVVYRKLVLAIAYLEEWADPHPPGVEGLPEVIIPFELRTLETVDMTWVAWRGSSGDWQIDEHEHWPSVRFQELPVICLMPAARPKLGNTIYFVLEGLEIMLRLTETEGEKMVHIWHGPRSDRLVLRRTMKNDWKPPKSDE